MCINIQFISGFPRFIKFHIYYPGFMVYCLFASVQKSRSIMQLFSAALTFIVMQMLLNCYCFEVNAIVTRMVVILRASSQK